jgi:flavin reductase (DIM6/NTAB) family NADH-FMN oxidoreductase RutF
VNARDADAIFNLADRELWLVTASDGPRRGGLIASFVSKASLVPELPRVLLGIARHHHTWGLIEASKAFALHLLDEEHLPWVWRFGLHSGRKLDKLDGLPSRPGASGSPLLEGVLGWLDCRVEGQMSTGDRTVYLGEVVQAELLRPGRPLTQQRLLQLASADQLRELQEQQRHDAALDADAIRAWRRPALPAG